MTRPRLDPIDTVRTRDRLVTFADGSWAAVRVRPLGVGWEILRDGERYTFVERPPRGGEFPGATPQGRLGAAAMSAPIRIMAQRLGGDVAGRDCVLCPGPGHSPRDRSLQVTFTANAPDGFLVHSFAGNDWCECRDHVRRLLGLPEWQPGDEQNRHVDTAKVIAFDRHAVNVQSQPRPRTDDDVERIQRARVLWCEAREPRGTLAETYLQKRGLALGDDLAGEVLRFHPRCPWRNENTGKTEFLPALLAAFRSVDDDAITAVHRIAINRDGDKLGRRMLGIVHRAAIKLDRDTSGGALAIGEGVETCMAARALGIRPAWALGSVGQIAHFAVLPGVTTLRIIGERDAASARAINEFCGPRWRKAGRTVRVILPTTGNDLNDALRGEA